MMLSTRKQFLTQNHTINRRAMFFETTNFETTLFLGIVHSEDVPLLETVFNLKLCLLVQESSIWNLLIMCGARDVTTGQLDVTPGTRGGAG
jgi:hypothetical protein